MKRRILLLSALALFGASTLPAMAADKIIVKIAGMKPDGEPETVGMKLFAMSTVLNTGLNYLLIFGKCGLPALGIQGAAVATLLARITEFAVCSFCAVRSRLLPIQWRAFFRPGWENLFGG